MTIEGIELDLTNREFNYASEFVCKIMEIKPNEILRHKKNRSPMGDTVASISTVGKTISTAKILKFRTKKQ